MFHVLELAQILTCFEHCACELVLVSNCNISQTRVHINELTKSTNSYNYTLPLESILHYKYEFSCTMHTKWLGFKKHGQSRLINNLI